MFFCGFHLNFKKSINTELRRVYGLNTTSIKKIQKNFGLNVYKSFKVFQVENKDIFKDIENFILQNFFVLKKNVKEYQRKRIQFLIKIKAYRGLRHKMLLPVRGQRTHTNAQTRKKIKKW